MTCSLSFLTSRVTLRVDVFGMVGHGWCVWRRTKVLKKGWRWAQCRACRSDIVKDHVRFGCSQGASYSWWCLGCVTGDIVRGVVEEVEAVDGVDGFMDLPDALKLEVKMAFADAQVQEQFVSFFGQTPDFYTQGPRVTKS